MLTRATRFLGALAILVVGAVHLQQYTGAGYQTIPTIGTLFLLNGIASAIIGLGLLAPVERVLPPRRADAAVGTLALTGVAIAAGSLVALFISESGSLFGFAESGYRTPIVVAIIAEAAALALLGPLAKVSLARAASRRGQAAGRYRSGRGPRFDRGAASEG